MNTVFQSVSVSGLLNAALWYIAISAVLSIAYGMYEAFRNNLHTIYGGDAPKRWLVKAALVSLLQSPFFPIYALGLARDKVLDMKRRRTQQHTTDADES